MCGTSMRGREDVSGWLDNGELAPGKLVRYKILTPTRTSPRRRRNIMTRVNPQPSLPTTNGEVSATVPTPTATVEEDEEPSDHTVAFAMCVSLKNLAVPYPDRLSSSSAWSITAVIIMAHFLASHIILYSTTHTCRLSSPHLWWLSFALTLVTYFDPLMLHSLHLVVLAVVFLPICYVRLSMSFILSQYSSPASSFSGTHAM